MTETITVDLERAKQLVEEAAQTWPERVDITGTYFDPATGNCSCVVGAVIERLEKSIDDLHIKESTIRDTEGMLDESSANYVGLDDIEIDGVTFTPEAQRYLDDAMTLNDSCIRWGDIPGKLERGER